MEVIGGDDNASYQLMIQCFLSIKLISRTVTVQFISNFLSFKEMRTFAFCITCCSQWLLVFIQIYKFL